MGESAATAAQDRVGPQDGIALGFLAGVVAVFFAPVWLLGWWLPKGGGDLVSFLWPAYTFASRTLKEGRLPLWNPHLHCGAPFLADNQMGVLYPPNLLVSLVTDEPYGALEALVVAHVLFTGVAMYTCLRWLAAPGRPGHLTPVLLLVLCRRWL